MAFDDSSAHRDLMELYREWKSLTESETRAIHEAAWPRLDRVQGEKLNLQIRIVEASQQVQTEMAIDGIAISELEKTLRPVVEELIRMEESNGRLLMEKRQRLEEEQAGLDRTSRNLRQVQQAYGSGSSAGWASYS